MPYAPARMSFHGGSRSCMCVSFSVPLLNINAHANVRIRPTVASSTRSSSLVRGRAAVVLAISIPHADLRFAVRTSRSRPGGPHRELHVRAERQGHRVEQRWGRVPERREGEQDPPDAAQGLCDTLLDSRISSGGRMESAIRSVCSYSSVCVCRMYCIGTNSLVCRGNGDPDFSRPKPL